MAEEARALGCAQCKTVLIPITRPARLSGRGLVASACMLVGALLLVAGIYADLTTLAGDRGGVVMILGLLVMILGGVIALGAPRLTVMICPSCGSEPITLR